MKAKNNEENMEAFLKPDFKGAQVLVGVSGGIAAYKTAELCRLLTRNGAKVRVMMTAAARQFVGEMTFAALTQSVVPTELFDINSETQFNHIALADETQLLIFAPATANLMGKLAHGIADNLVTTVYLAYLGPVLFAPAMNHRMWAHPATQENLSILEKRGHSFVGPESGELACGHEGAGRMAEPEQILEAAGYCLTSKSLKGKRLLVTAGPTFEAVDPVRFIGNRSSGRMGFSIAAEAAARGAKVLLVAGPVALPTPLNVERINVTSAYQMSEAVMTKASDQHAIIMSAAVADFHVKTPATTKIKKEHLGEGLSLDLERNPDILATLGRMASRPYLVGFAAETGGDLESEAKRKLADKQCDLLVVNDVSAKDAGFEVDTNRVAIYNAAGQCDSVPLMEKRMVAGVILDRLCAAIS